MNERTVIREWFVVKCVRCGHVWDECDPEDEVCACILNYGHRQVRIVSAGAANYDGAKP